MLKKCSVILADEPTGSLDSGNAGVVISLLKQLNKKGKTVIMVTHDNSILDNEMRIINWSRVHNLGDYDISIGMFGSIYDEDFSKKVKLIEEITGRSLN